MAKKKKQIQSLPPWTKHAWWAVPLLALLIYLPVYNSDFTLDDILIVEENELIRSPEHFSTIWTSHYWAGKIDATDTGLYRPLTTTTYAIQYWISGAKGGPFHILNIILHALTCFVLMRYVNYLFKDLRLTILTGVLFAIHPVHTEAVAGIVGRAEMMASLFILLAGISYHHYRQSGKGKWLLPLVLSSMAAVTSKEHGFMIPFILVLQEAIYFFNTRKKIKNPAGAWTGIGSALLVSVIFWAIHSSITGPSKPHEQWLDAGAGERMATSVRTTAEYIGLHLLPIKQSADYWTDTVRIEGWTSPGVLLALLFCAVILFLAVSRFSTMRAFSWGTLFFFLTLAPVSNFFFAAGFLKAERILYIPSIGLITAMAALLLKLYDIKKARMAAIVLMAGLTGFFMIKTWQRAGVWKNNFTLAEATLKSNPDSPRFNNMMGLEMRSQQKNDEALRYFEKAVQSNPNHVPALVNLGTEYRHFNRLQEAASVLEKALAIDPLTMMTYVNLMAVYRDLKDYDKNLAIAELALQRFPSSAPVLWNAGNAYQLKGNMAKAEELRGKAREINPEIMKK